MNDQDSSKPQPPSAGGGKKLVVLAVVIAAAAVAYWQFGDALSLDYLAERESSLRAYQADHPVLVYGVAFLIYVAVTGLSLPGAAGLTLLFGWYFGFWRGVILVSLASTTGATLAFLLSRFVIGSSVQAKFGERLANFNKALEREGPFFLFTLRLIPLVPFFVINVVMGLTPIRTWTYWWVSQIGMLPGTCAYVYAGSSVPNLQALATDGIQAVFTPQQLLQMGIAFGVLGVLPFLLRFLLKFIEKLLGRSTTSQRVAGDNVSAER